MGSNYFTRFIELMNLLHHSSHFPLTGLVGFTAFSFQKKGENVDTNMKEATEPGKPAQEKATSFKADYAANVKEYGRLMAELFKLRSGLNLNALE